MGKNILIAGGSGLIGTEVRKLFEAKGYTVAVLTRNPTGKPYKCFYWDYEKDEIDDEALKFTDIIINLAGENISDGRWNLRKKEKIINSRVLTTNLIFDKIREIDKKPDAYISASAIGYYGTNTFETIFTEDMPSGNDFLSTTVKLWEDAAESFNLIGIRAVKLRIGVVLSSKGGALPKLTQTVKTGFGSAVGTGRQYMPWIHASDLAEMFYFFASTDDLSGTYNAVSPEYITNSSFMRLLAKSLNKPFFMPKVPSLVMKTLFGEMSSIMLEGSRVSADKLIGTGFKYSFPNLQTALNDLNRK